MNVSINKHKALNDFLLLLMLWYLLLALTVPSLLQASSVAILILAFALTGYRKPFVAVWQHTKFAWLLVAAAFLVGLVSSGMPVKSLTGLYHGLRALALFLSVSAILSSLPGPLILNTAKYLNIAAAIGLFMIFMAIGIASGSFSLRANTLLTQHIGNLHEFANLTAVSFLMLACLYFTDLKTKLWLIPPALLLSVTLLATTSRGNWAAVLLCLCYLCCRNSYRFIGYGVLALFLAIYIYSFFICTDNCSLPISLQSTIHARQSIYTETLALFSQQPWTGHGINTFKFSSGLIDPVGDRYIMPHNIYLEQLYAWGILGTGLFFSGLIGLTARFNHLASAKNTTATFLHLSGATLLIYCLSRGLVDMKFFSFHFMGLLAFALALMDAARQQQAQI